jgi:membrane protein DedA with SNARE-associated domain
VSAEDQKDRAEPAGQISWLLCVRKSNPWEAGHTHARTGQRPASVSCPSPAWPQILKYWLIFRPLWLGHQRPCCRTFGMEHFLTSHGYLALIVLCFVEACCIPISSEITFALGGWLASQGKYSLALVIMIGTLAEMGGSLTSYAIGRRGGRNLVDRFGKWVLVSEHDVDRAERFFAGRGTWAVAVARVLPLVRCFASFGAGVVEIPALPFAIFSLIGTAAWASALSLLGYNLGSTVTKFFHSFTVVSIILFVVLVVGLVAHRIYAIRKDAARARQAPTDPAEPKVSSGRSVGAHRSTRGPSA